MLQGALCRTLQGHGHWVNYLALNTDYVMRTGAFDPVQTNEGHIDTSPDGRFIVTFSGNTDVRMIVVIHVLCLLA